MFDQLYTMLLLIILFSSLFKRAFYCFSKIDVTINALSRYDWPIRKLAGTIFHYFIFYALPG
jgi:hypothetical protein